MTEITQNAEFLFSSAASNVLPFNGRYGSLLTVAPIRGCSRPYENSHRVHSRHLCTASRSARFGSKNQSGFPATDEDWRAGITNRIVVDSREKHRCRAGDRRGSN